jgi:hypothetical protein
MQTFPLASVSDEVSVNHRVPQSRQNKHALGNTSSGLDVDYPFNRMASHGCLGSNHRANGRGSVLGISHDCGRTACKPIGDWRRADLDGPRASSVLEPILAEAGINKNLAHEARAPARSIFA